MDGLRLRFRTSEALLGLVGLTGFELSSGRDPRGSCGQSPSCCRARRRVPEVVARHGDSFRGPYGSTVWLAVNQRGVQSQVMADDRREPSVTLG